MFKLAFLKVVSASIKLIDAYSKKLEIVANL